MKMFEWRRFQKILGEFAGLTLGLPWMKLDIINYFRVALK